ncbi:MAG: hypothetical protein JXQ75_10560, partial [Phycisphaerae bacterium]|nr:hypothetical protein [Phycisphaerae bacterium]
MTPVLLPSRLESDYYREIEGENNGALVRTDIGQTEVALEPGASTAFHRKRDYDCWTENPFSVLKPVPRKDSRQSV